VVFWEDLWKCGNIGKTLVVRYEKKRFGKLTAAGMEVFLEARKACKAEELSSNDHLLLGDTPHGLMRPKERSEPQDGGAAGEESQGAQSQDKDPHLMPL
jgi:hypothetical protein